LETKKRKRRSREKIEIKIEDDDESAVKDEVIEDQEMNEELVEGVQIKIEKNEDDEDSNQKAKIPKGNHLNFDLELLSNKLLLAASSRDTLGKNRTAIYKLRGRILRVLQEDRIVAVKEEDLQIRLPKRRKRDPRL